MVKRKQPENDAIIFSMGAQMGADSQMGMDSQMGTIEKVIARTETIKDYSSEKESSALIKYEITFMDAPLCSLNNNVEDGEIITVVFSKEKNKYMRIIPDNDPRSRSYKVPQAFADKILSAIFKKATDSNSRIIITDFPELARLAGVDPDKAYNDIEDSLQRLRNSRYEFYNMFYVGINGKVRPGNLSLNILSSLFVGPKEGLQTAELTRKEKDLCQSVFSQKKVKKFIVLKLADEIYDNLHCKSGWLSVNHKILLALKGKNETAARFLYRTLLKWGGDENRTNLNWNNKLLVDCRDIAASLGLDWEGANVSKTLSSIKKAADILKEKEFEAAPDIKEKGVLIEDFKILPTKPKQPLSESVIEFHFKPGVFNKNKAIENEQTDIFDKIIQPILDKIPAEFQTDNVKQLLKKACENKGFDFANSTVEYVLKQKPGNVEAYLADALSKGYAITAATKNADSQTKQQGKNNKAAAGGFSADVEKLFQEIPKKERSENPDRIKGTINKYVKKNGADYVEKGIYYAVLNVGINCKTDNFPVFFERVLKKNEAASENPETLKAQFQKLLEKREQEANKPKTEKEIEKAYNEELKAAATEKYKSMSDAEKAALHEKLEGSGKEPCDFDKFSIWEIAKDLEKEARKISSYSPDAPDYEKTLKDASDAGYKIKINHKYFDLK